MYVAVGRLTAGGHGTTRIVKCIVAERLGQSAPVCLIHNAQRVFYTYDFINPAVNTLLEHSRQSWWASVWLYSHDIKLEWVTLCDRWLEQASMEKRYGWKQEKEKEQLKQKEVQGKKKRKRRKRKAGKISLRETDRENWEMNADTKVASFPVEGKSRLLCRRRWSTVF